MARGTDPDSRATSARAVSLPWLVEAWTATGSGSASGPAESRPGSSSVTIAVADKTRRSSSCVIPREIKPRSALPRAVLDRLLWKSVEPADLPKRYLCHIGEDYSKEIHDERSVKTNGWIDAIRPPIAGGQIKGLPSTDLAHGHVQSLQFRDRRGRGRRQNSRSGHWLTTTVAPQLVRSDEDYIYPLDYLWAVIIATFFAG